MFGGTVGPYFVAHSDAPLIGDGGGDRKATKPVACADFFGWRPICFSQPTGPFWPGGSLLVRLRYCRNLPKT